MSSVSQSWLEHKWVLWPWAAYRAVFVGAQDAVQVVDLVSYEPSWRLGRFSHGHHLIMLRMACGGALSCPMGRGDG